MDGGGGEPLARLRGSQVVYEIEEAETKIGRKESCDIVFPESRSVSGVHSILEVRAPGEAYLHDLNSLNGCFVNNVRVQNTVQRLSHGDNIRFGYDVQSFRLEFPGMQDEEKAQQGDTRRSRSSGQGEERDTVGEAGDGEAVQAAPRATSSTRTRSRPASAQPAHAHPAHSSSQSPPTSRPRPQSSRLARSAALPPRPRSGDDSGSDGGGGVSRPVKHAATMGGAQAELRSLKRMLSRQQFLAKEDEAASKALLQRSSAATDSPALRDRTKREAERIEEQRRKRTQKIEDLERRVSEVDKLIESGSLPAQPAGVGSRGDPEDGSLAFAAATGRQQLRVGSSEAATAGERSGPAGTPSGHSAADTSGLDFASSLRRPGSRGGGAEDHAPFASEGGGVRRSSSSRRSTRGRSTSRSPGRGRRAGSTAAASPAGSRGGRRQQQQQQQPRGAGAVHDPFEGMGGGGDEALPPMLQSDGEEEEEEDEFDPFAGMGGEGDEALPPESTGRRRSRGSLRRSAPGGVGTGRRGAASRGQGETSGRRTRDSSAHRAAGGGDDDEEDEDEDEDEDDPFAGMGGGGDEALPDMDMDREEERGRRSRKKVPSAERAARAEGEARARAEMAEQLAVAQREVARLRPFEGEVETLRAQAKEAARQVAAATELRTSLAEARAELDTERARVAALEKLVASLRAAESASSRRCTKAEQEVERLRGGADWARVASEQALQLRSLQSSLAQRAKEAKEVRQQLAAAVKGSDQGTASLQAFLAEHSDSLRAAKAEAEELQRRLALAETQRDRARAELRRATSANAQRARDQSEDLAALRKQLRERDGKMVMLYKQLAVLAASEGPAKGWGRGPGAMVPRSALPPASPQYYYGGVEKAGQGAITSHAGPAAAGKLQGLSPQGRTRAEAAKLLVRQLRDQAALQGERDELAHKCSALQRQVERMRAEAQGAEAAAKATAGEVGGAGERGDDALAGLGREDLIEALRELKRDGGARAVAESNQLAARVQEQAAEAEARAEHAEQVEGRARLEAHASADRCKAAEDELRELQQRVAQLHLLLETGTRGGRGAVSGGEGGEGTSAPAPTPATPAPVALDPAPPAPAPAVPAAPAPAPAVPAAPAPVPAAQALAPAAPASAAATGEGVAETPVETAAPGAPAPAAAASAESEAAAGGASAGNDGGAGSSGTFTIE